MDGLRAASCWNLLARSLGPCSEIVFTLKSVLFSLEVNHTSSVHTGELPAMQLFQVSR